ncbi:unnamed protein product [Moneuplotes crassus]|uniref:Arrestin-like N-terminal domain-containing protein n=1 Tax=Euplotes crassus TaxID=5936 RepID=A0AAD1UCT9_EUPCR|nr:unnamed protein product [Moneuplotes crassus]
MGNIDSKYKFEHGNVYLQTDKAYFVAGEQITGNIYLNLTMGFPASNLEIKVEGKEKCKWTTRESKEVKEGDTTRTEFVDVWHKNERKVITYKVPVYYFPGGMAPPGQYTFPFSFALPSNLPASIYYCGFDKASAYIKYKIKAVLEPSMGVKAKKMKFKQPLVIRQPVSESLMAPIQSDERNVYACCCCCSKGVAKITTQFEKDGYCPEETCRAMCDVDNSQCSRDINNITIELKQHVELRSKDERTFTDNRVLESKEYDGLAANSNTGGMTRYLELSLAGIRQQARPFDDVKPLSADDLYLAERMQPSSHGNAVKLWYTLTVFCNYGTCCAQEPHCTIPLTITPPPLPSFGQVQAPAGWSPTVFNTFEFNLPGPGEMMSAAAITAQVAPISGNISMNVGGNAQYNEEVKMDMNLAAPPPVSVEMNIPPPAPAMNFEVTGNTMADPNQAQMNMNMGGMGMNIDMQVEGNATYHQESTKNGVTTSVTTHGNVPPPSMGFGTDVSAGVGVGMGGGVGISETEDNVQMQANVGVPGVNMGMNMNFDQ